MFNSDVKLGIVPIARISDNVPDLGKGNTFERCISEVALVGFKGPEVGNKYPRDVEVFRKALELRDTEIASAWLSALLTTKPYEETEKASIEHRDFLNATGVKVIVVPEQEHSIQGQMETPIFDGKHVLNEEEWRTLAEGLNKLGALVKEKGMKLVYHHHMGTAVQTTEETDKLMDLTDENLVYLLFDSGHLVYPGEDALEVLEKCVNRVRYIHLKDIRKEKVGEAKRDKLSFLQGARKGVFTIPGDGDIDSEPVFKALDDNNYKGYLLAEAEQDPVIINPLEYAIKAGKYIKEKTNL